jgi:hypothetical protein
MFLAGCLLSWAVVGIDPVRRRPGTWVRLTALIIAAAGHDTLAKLIHAWNLPAAITHAESTTSRFRPTPEKLRPRHTPGPARVLSRLPEPTDSRGPPPSAPDTRAMTTRSANSSCTGSKTTDQHPGCRACQIPDTFSRGAYPVPKRLAVLPLR